MRTPDLRHPRPGGGRLDESLAIATECVVLWKQLGWADLGKSVVLMLASCLLVGFALNLLIH